MIEKEVANIKKRSMLEQNEGDGGQDRKEMEPGAARAFRHRHYPEFLNYKTSAGYTRTLSFYGLLEES